MSERQEHGLVSLTDVVDTDETQYMIRKIIDHALELQETVSLPPGHTYPTTLSVSWCTFKCFNTKSVI